MKKVRTLGRILGWLLVFILLIAILLLAAGKEVRIWLITRGHGNVIVADNDFTESARALQNPYRGFYHMHGFIISDAETDFRADIANRYCRDEDTALTMVEINLQRYREGDISQAGLDNIERLMETLKKVDKQLILRFLYDWDGQNDQVEPESLEIILRHMEQVGPLVQEYRDSVFLLQGLFIGNWGEMNGTKYLAADDLQALAGRLAEVTDESTFLAVRMPAQWRIITQLASAETVVRGDGSLASRLGLFNDGMLGSWSDYGTYGNQSYATHGAFTYWNREEELVFQDELCRLVPIGGEVIVDNEYNDFENAIQDMASMHVTYVNRDYDTNVFNKWASSVFRGGGVFNGMDGLSYIERHLGYRLLIRDVNLGYDFKEDSLSVDVTLQNVGFAPVYREVEVHVLLYDQEKNRLYSYEIEEDIRNLTGGNDTETLQTLHTDISLAGEQPGEWKVFFEIRDIFSGQRILLANEQEAEKYGYQIGEVTIGSVEKLLEEWDAEYLLKAPFNWELISVGTDE